MTEFAAAIDDKPVNRKPTTFGECLHIVMHPAFRLGFLDALQSRPFNHDKIVDRIFAETPAGALKRLGLKRPALDLLGCKDHSTELAQYRYEEGRALALEYGISCKAWGHPDFPPAQVVRFCEERAGLGRPREAG